MLTASKWLLIIGGALLALGALLRFGGINTLPLVGWAIPCPISLLIVGVGILLFALSSNAFKK